MSPHAMIDIAGLVPVDDPFYRYKMPAAICTYEKRWTVLVNLDKIASVLHRPVQEVLKYLGVEFCTQTAFRERRSCVKGHFTAVPIQQAIQN